jgi:hypothetical protein
MGTRVFFHAEDVIVSSEAVTVGATRYPIQKLIDARSRHTRRWFREFFELVLIHGAAEEVTVLRHRNGYFIFQLVHAIHAALEDHRMRAVASAVPA